MILYWPVGSDVV